MSVAFSVVVNYESDDLTDADVIEAIHAAGDDICAEIAEMITVALEHIPVDAIFTVEATISPESIAPLFPH